MLFRMTVGLGTAEDRDHLGSVVRDSQESPTALPHVGAPGDELFPCLGGCSEHSQVGDPLPLGRVRFAAGHQVESSGAISRVLFGHARWPDGHLSGMAVASHLVRPTRSSNDPGRVSLPIWPCSDWGLPCHGRYRPRGGLLPHHFTLTRCRAVYFLWPCPSPFGAQALPGSLPCGARTFLDEPFLPARRDHRAPPSPRQS
jgi:hypothetical protein